MPGHRGPDNENETRTIQMHALDWLNKRGCILRGAIQLSEGVHFHRSRFRSRFRSRYRGLCGRPLALE